MKDSVGTNKGNVIPVIDVMPADLLTPLAVYLKLAKDSRFSFLLESVEGGENLARYSFIGTNPVFAVSGNDRRVRVVSRETTTTIETGMMEFLKGHFSSIQRLNDD